MRKVFSYNNRPPILINKTMGRVRLSNNLSGSDILHDVHQREFYTGVFLNLDLNLDIIAVCCGRFVLATDGHDGRCNAFVFQSRHRIPNLGEEVHSCFFHKPNVIGVMRDSHFIGFVVINFVYVLVH